MLLDTDAFRHRFASSSLEDIEEDTSLLSHATYAFLAFPLFSLMKYALSLLSLLGHYALI